MRPHVLIAEADPELRRALVARLEAEGLETSTADNGGALRKLLHGCPPAAVVLDAELGVEAECDLVAEVLELTPPPALLVLSARGDLAAAVETVRRGADHFLQKPLDCERLLPPLLTALARRAATRGGDAEPRVIGLAGLLGRLDRIAATRSTVLLRGETGSGKALLARRCHARSPLAAEPFEPRACADLAPDDLERTLAGAGAVLLDEVADLSPAAQERCLCVLEGGGQHARVFAATCRDLERLAADGGLRADLFYRLNVHSVAVPPLRERLGDLAPLAAAFLADEEHRLGRRFAGFTDAALERLRAHDWPGNVSELRTVVERAAALAPDEPRARIAPGHLGLGDERRSASSRRQEGERATDGDLSLRAVEEAHIRRVLERVDGNRSRAARLLGVNRTTLYSKLRRYAIEI